jgi:hypothetical protein
MPSQTVLVEIEDDGYSSGIPCRTGAVIILLCITFTGLGLFGAYSFNKSGQLNLNIPYSTELILIPDDLCESVTLNTMSASPASASMFILPTTAELGSAPRVELSEIAMLSADKPTAYSFFLRGKCDSLNLFCVF